MCRLSAYALAAPVYRKQKAPNCAFREVPVRTAAALQRVLEGNKKQGVEFVLPSPATHAMLTHLKAGETVDQREFGCWKH